VTGRLRFLSASRPSATFDDLQLGQSVMGKWV
jgi:hypothetical protein